MVVCIYCNSNYSIDLKNCPNCMGMTENSFKADPKIKTISDQLFLNNEFKNRTNENLQTINTIKARVNPPPPPRINQTHPENTSSLQSRNYIGYINLDLRDDPQTIMRRASIFVFNRENFDLLVQYPWLTIESSNFASILTDYYLDEENTIRIKLKLRIFHLDSININNNNIDELIKQLDVQDEMFLALNKTFIIIKDSLISNNFYNYFENLGKKNQKNDYYYVSTNDLKYFPTFNLANVDKLVLQLITNQFSKQLDQSRLKIVKDLKNPLILDQQLNSQEQNNSTSSKNLKISSMESTICFAHNGIVLDGVLCMVCQKHICLECKSSFLICPGSIFTKPHKIKLE